MSGDVGKGKISEEEDFMKTEKIALIMRKSAFQGKKTFQEPIRYSVVSIFSA